MKRKSHPSTPAANDRLAALFESKKNLIVFHSELPDNEYPQVRCSIYGATETNELFVKLASDKAAFVEAIDSPLLAPSMADRIFGMDAADAQAAFELAERMWTNHKKELLGE